MISTSRRIEIGLPFLDRGRRITKSHGTDRDPSFARRMEGKRKECSCERKKDDICLLPTGISSFSLFQINSFLHLFPHKKECSFSSSHTSTLHHFLLNKDILATPHSYKCHRLHQHFSTSLQL